MLERMEVVVVAVLVLVELVVSGLLDLTERLLLVLVLVAVVWGLLE
jgi:hypothetical protein